MLQLILIKMKDSYLQSETQPPALCFSHSHMFFEEEYFEAKIQTECRAMILQKNILICHMKHSLSLLYTHSSHSSLSQPATTLWDTLGWMPEEIEILKNDEVTCKLWVFKLASRRIYGRGQWVLFLTDTTTGQDVIKGIWLQWQD